LVNNFFFRRRKNIFVKPGYSAVCENRLWPNKMIPYVISNNYSKISYNSLVLTLKMCYLIHTGQSETNMILDAMASIQSRTCIKFIPRTTEPDYVNIYQANLGYLDKTKV